MVNSATDGVRSRRKMETRTALIRAARRLTAEHGLSGFTLDELSEQVGVSRRTFFNYFSSKEDAVVGRISDELDEGLLAEFAYSPPAGPLLLEVLADLAIHIFEVVGIDRDEVVEFKAALDREPRLLGTLMRSSEDSDVRLTRAVAVREHRAADDPIPAMAVALIGMIVRRAAYDYFETDNRLLFADLVRHHLTTAQLLLAPTDKEPIDHLR